MTFLAPERLILLLVPLVLVGIYVARQRSRRRYALRFTDLELLGTVAPRRPAWRRHVAALAYLAAVVLLAVGAARPATAVEVPSQTTVVLALDASISMEATDVDPSRIAAAREAARRFLELVPEGTRVGLVAFDSGARALAAPTIEKDAVLRAIDRLRLGPGTAVGEAIHTALDLLPTAEAADEDRGPGTGTGPGAASSGSGPDDPDGELAAGAIVLLSDGETTVGRPPDEAAERARDLRVRISTIAFGTDAGTVVVDGMTVPVPVDRDALERIAEITGGQTFEAETAEEVTSVFEGLGRGVGTRTEPREVTDGVVMAALLAGLVAAGASLLWFNRLP